MPILFLILPNTTAGALMVFCLERYPLALLELDMPYLVLGFSKQAFASGRHFQANFAG